MTKTVRFHELGGPEVLRLDDVEVGEPGPGEVRVRIDAIGLNRAEALFRRGVYIEAARLPSGLGAEAAGVVEAVGPGVSGIEAGQAVSVLPAFSQTDYAVYAERAIVPAKALVPRAEDVDAVAGAAVWMPYLTAYGAMVEVVGVQPGDTVVVNAASSSVGLAAIRVANRIGARAIAITRTAAKRGRLLEQGAADVVASDDEPDLAARIFALTDGEGAAHVFDAVAGPGSTALARTVAADGTLLLWGMQSGEPTPFPGFDLGMPPLSLRTYTVHEITRDPVRLRRALAFVSAGLRDGAFRPVIDTTFTLDEIVAAHAHLESNRQVGKIVVIVAH